MNHISWSDSFYFFAVESSQTQCSEIAILGIMFICPKRRPIFSLTEEGMCLETHGYWMKLPHVIGILRLLPSASGRCPNASFSIAIRHAVICRPPPPPQPKHHHLSSSHTTVLSCWKFPGPAGFDASVSLLMGLPGLTCSCLHLTYSAEASHCLRASLNLAPFSSCAWKAVFLSVSTPSAVCSATVSYQSGSR